MYKTIKQIADDIGVDKQRVYRYIKRKHISEAHQQNGVMYYDDVAQSTIIRAFTDNTTSSDVHRDVHQNHISDVVNDTVDVVVDVLKSQIETLQAQLEVKDKQIEQLRAELAEEREQNRQNAAELRSLSATVGDSLRHITMGQAAAETQQLVANMQQQVQKNEQPLKKHWWQRKA